MNNPVIWFEIYVENLPRARAFYESVLGITLENLNNLLTGKLDPVTGFMGGKFKVTGDMSVAMKLQRVV